MLKEIQASNSVVIKGPASATLIEGRVMVFGSELNTADKTVVRRGKSIPFKSEVDSVLEIVLGAEAGLYELEDAPIHSSWTMAVNEVLSERKPCTLIVLGAEDSGKTSFSTLLVNRAIESKLKPAVIDLDLGQSVIGPPASIGFSLVSEPVTDLFSLEPDSVLFIGRLSSKGIQHRVISSLNSMIKRVSKGEADLIVITTDSWIRGERAASHKLELIMAASPSILVGIQRKRELESLLLSAEEDYKVIRLPPSTAVGKRNLEERSELRGQGYKKYLGEPTLRNLNMRWIKLEYTSLGLGETLDDRRLEALEEDLRCRILYCEESSEGLYTVVDKDQKLDPERASAAEGSYESHLILVRAGEEEGLLVGLLDRDREFLGLGVISEIDYVNGVLKLYASCGDGISVVQFGQIRVDSKGNELGFTSAFVS